MFWSGEGEGEGGEGREKGKEVTGGRKGVRQKYISNERDRRRVGEKDERHCMY